MDKMNLDIMEQADKDYNPIPMIDEWLSIHIDDTKWNKYQSIIDEYKKDDKEILEKSIDVVKRATAIDTGAIEGLYDVDRGFTFTVATQAAMWEIQAREKRKEFLPLFESQLKAYDMVIDLATKKEPITEAWIRRLHEEICRSQKTYKIYTKIGDELVEQEHELNHGEYKKFSNHVITSDGKVHSYAPVLDTPSEMNRLCMELGKESFQDVHPVIQASYAHYALVAIHPFSDGNRNGVRLL